MASRQEASDWFNARYGAELPGDFDSRIAPFWSHQSVRQFSNDPIPDSIVAQLIAAAQSAATSSNLQLWSVISVDRGAVREELATITGDQKHVRESPLFLAFLADHHRLAAAASVHGESPAGFDYAEAALLAVIDASLAAERLVCAAEAIGLGICYIGAMRNDVDRVAQLLRLPERVFCPFGLCLGYAQAADLPGVKPRLDQSAVWFHNTYPKSIDLAPYDDRMADFYAQQGADPGRTWSERSARRMQLTYFGGREKIREILASRGFWRS